MLSKIVKTIAVLSIAIPKFFTKDLIDKFKELCKKIKNIWKP